MRKQLHKLYLGFVLSFILHKMSDLWSTNSTVIIINDIQTDLLLEHVQAHLVKERKMTLSITWAFPTERRQYCALSCTSTALDYTILISFISFYFLLILQENQINCFGWGIYPIIFYDNLIAFKPVSNKT